MPIYRASIDELKQVLRLVMVKVGLRSTNWPQDEEKAILIDHIITEFGGNRIDEIKLAFDMAISGKLDIDDVNCFENFSCAYISKIMIAYRNWAAEAAKGMTIDNPPRQIILTDKQIEDLYRRDIENAYQQMRSGRVPYGLPDHFKEILVKDKLMKEDESLNNFFVQRLGKGFENIYLPIE